MHNRREAMVAVAAWQFAAISRLWPVSDIRCSAAFNPIDACRLSRKGSKSRPLVIRLKIGEVLSHEPYVCERPN